MRLDSRNPSVWALPTTIGSWLWPDSVMTNVTWPMVDLCQPPSLLSPSFQIINSNSDASVPHWGTCVPFASLAPEPHILLMQTLAPRVGLRSLVSTTRVGYLAWVPRPLWPQAQALYWCELSFCFSTSQKINWKKRERKRKKKGKEIDTGKPMQNFMEDHLCSSFVGDRLLGDSLWWQFTHPSHVTISKVS